MADTKPNRVSDGTIRIPAELLAELRKIAGSYLMRGAEPPPFGSLLLEAWRTSPRGGMSSGEGDTKRPKKAVEADAPSCDVVRAISAIREANHAAVADSLEGLHASLLLMTESLAQELKVQAHVQSEGIPVPKTQTKTPEQEYEERGDQLLRNADALAQASESNRKSSQRALKDLAAAKRNEGGAKRA